MIRGECAMSQALLMGFTFVIMYVNGNIFSLLCLPIWKEHTVPSGSIRMSYMGIESFVSLKLILT